MGLATRIVVVACLALAHRPRLAAAWLPRRRRWLFGRLLSFGPRALSPALPGSGFAPGCPCLARHCTGFCRVLHGLHRHLRDGSSMLAFLRLCAPARRLFLDASPAIPGDGIGFMASLRPHSAPVKLMRGGGGAAEPCHALCSRFAPARWR